jgi:hypothetical protein
MQAWKGIAGSKNFKLVILACKSPFHFGRVFFQNEKLSYLIPDGISRKVRKGSKAQKIANYLQVSLCVNPFSSLLRMTMMPN